MKKILLLIITFTFAFNSYAQFPEDFSGAVFPPAGWTTFIGVNGTGTTNNWIIKPRSGDNAAYVEYEGGGLNEDWLVTPQITIDATNSTLFFDQDDSYGTDYGTAYYVKVSTASQTTHADFVTVDTQGEADVHTGDANLATRTVDLSAYVGQQVYVAFVMEQNDGDDWYIDNVNFTVPVTCGEVSDIIVDTQNLTSLDLSWTVGTPGTPTGYSFEYGPLGFTQGTGTTATLNTNSVSISGLNEGTGYDVYVQADCAADGLSTWAGSSVFTGSTPYNVYAGHNNPSNGIENGANCDADNTTAPKSIAHDIIVPANTTLSLTKIVPHVLLIPGVSATTVNVTVYEDILGLPGTVLSNQATIAPTSSKNTGTNYGYIVNELELDLTPVSLVNNTGSDKSFWIGISVSKSDGAGASNAFWENTTVSPVGSGQAYDDGAAGFVSDAALDGVYSFIATNTASVKDDVLSTSVSVYPTATKDNFTIKNESNVALTSVSLFDINGRVVLTQELENLIGEESINISNLSTGMYFVELSSADAKTTKKIIKK